MTQMQQKFTDLQTENMEQKMQIAEQKREIQMLKVTNTYTLIQYIVGHATIVLECEIRVLAK